MADAGVPAVAFPNPERPVADIVSPIWHNEKERDVAGEPRQLVRLLGIKSGMTVADIGAGSGYYVVRLSPIVGRHGRVIAEDVVPEYLRGLRRRVRDLGLQNVAIGLGEPHDPRLPLIPSTLRSWSTCITRSHSLTPCSTILSSHSSLARASVLLTPSGGPPSMVRHQASCAVSLQPRVSRDQPRSPHGQRRLSCDLRATIRREPDAAGSYDRVQSAIRVRCVSPRALAIRLRAAGVGSWSHRQWHGLPCRHEWMPDMGVSRHHSIGAVDAP